MATDADIAAASEQARADPAAMGVGKAFYPPEHKTERVKEYCDKYRHVHFGKRSGCMTGDGKLWQARRRDMLKYMRTSTNMLQSENDQLVILLKLGQEIQQELRDFQEKADEIDRSGGHIGDIDEDNVYGLLDKLVDCRSVLASMAATHQYIFNPHIEEYMRVHKEDFSTYIKYEAKFLESEERRPPAQQASWLINQCKTNIDLMGQSLQSLFRMEKEHFERNKIVIRNEAKLLRGMTNIHKSCECAKAFVNRFCDARGIPIEDRPSGT